MYLECDISAEVKLYFALFVVYLQVLTFTNLLNVATSCYSGVNSRICVKNGLNAVPSELQSQGDLDLIDLADNSIKIIRSNDFRGTRTRVLDLSRNDVTLIEDGAFDSMFLSNATLILNSNNLTELPNTLSKITTIINLDVRNNPAVIRGAGGHVIELTDSIMKEMGDSLQTLSFGHPELDKWPESLSHLQDLHELTLDGADANLDVIPPTAFRSFESTLKKLTIENTQLTSVPMGVSHLRRLTEFDFEHNINTGDAGMIMQAFYRPNSPITNLSLVGNGLTQFPRALIYLPRLMNLNMSENHLEFISDDVIKSLGVKTLALRNCQLSRVPGALSTMKDLTDLDLSHNSIISVENNDLISLKNIKKLSFNSNPVAFISEDAFENSTRLVDVLLRNTSLTEIPDAFRHGVHITTVDMSKNDITCMCKYYWVVLNESKIPVVKFLGSCGNIDVTLVDYLTKYAPNCPKFVEEYAKIAVTIG